MRLRIEEKYSVKEVADALQISPSTASRWLKGTILNRPRDASRVTSAAKAGREKLRKMRIDAAQELSDCPPFVRTVDPDSLSRMQKGAAAEALVSFRLVLIGCAVFSASSDGATEDWVARTPSGKFARIQVRWVRRDKRGSDLTRDHVSLVRTTRQGSRRISSDDYDFLAAYSLYDDAVYVWSSEELSDFKVAASVTLEAREAWHKILTW